MTLAAKKATAAPDRTLAGFSPPAGTEESGASGTMAAAMAAATMGVATDEVSPVSSAQLPEGAIVGERYVLSRHISSGSFGAVYKAQDRFIDNHAVALKLLHRPAGSSEERETALRELRLLASVSHPSVVQFKDYGWLDGRLWFTMPWYDGITLQERLSPRDDGRPRALSRRQARFIFERLAHGLAAMHSVGIHHHDIKPDNIFLAKVAGFDDGGLPVLLDLGVAAESGESPVGFTAQYVAPETAAAALGRDDQPIGPKADVFALALTLREALAPETRPTAFTGPAIPQLNLRAHKPIDPPTRRDLRFLAPHFRRWLNLDPEQRPTAAEFAAELSVLTAPEDRRDVLKRTLRRTAPFLLLLGGLVAGLWYRLGQQESQLNQQRVQLTVQKRETERIKQESDETLEQMEAQLAAMGEQGAQLRRAVEIARRKDNRLKAAERERRVAVRDLRERERELARLEAAHKDLQAKLNLLDVEHAAMLTERDQLRTSADLLQSERDELRAVRKDLAAMLSTSQNDLQQVRERALVAEQELQSMRGRISRLESQQVQLATQRKDAASALAELRAERDRLAASERALRAQLARLRGSRQGSADSDPRAEVPPQPFTAPAPLAAPIADDPPTP